MDLIKPEILQRIYDYSVHLFNLGVPEKEFPEFRISWKEMWQISEYYRLKDGDQNTRNGIIAMYYGVSIEVID